ncbi:hypothetical protein K437DRAFT_260457 [Tilletiaria anomala UBC 951]|uniref:Uncharacterized protein n=1 Tax=Tilletiaria anomala (strain ATCC 24038 / CBS 436.72 / UBC 951) TaxID=1037660 RepID=A0A066WLP1_TILAU|nr:uncharacterized protein K437DRAFT_260457 [Tilletiaria anomala UBC 951]KDN53513.1 hypothetical protein K437DRAFT_260457 [Tilletiaria anomala UBC 951]
MSLVQERRRIGLNLHFEHSNGSSTAKWHSPEPISSASRKGILSASLEGIHSRPDGLLKAQAETDNLAGIAARKCLQDGAWVEEPIETGWEFRRDAIPGIDSLWIFLSSTTSGFNPVFTATHIFHSPLTFEEVKAAIEKQKLQGYGRGWHSARFVEDPNWAVERHLRVERLPEPAGLRELEAYTGRFIAQQWDLNKPLWECVLLENFHDSESCGKGAMITRGHHTSADGVGFVMSQLYITSYGADMERLLKEDAQPLHEARRGSAKPSKLHKALQSLDAHHQQFWLQIAMFGLYWTVFSIQTILELYGSIIQTWITSVIFFLTFWRQRYVTNWAPGSIEKKEFSTSKTFPMDDVKKLQRAFSGPRPDVVADELDARGRGPGLANKMLTVTDYFLPNPIGLFIPINIRPISDATMRNWSTGGIAYLPGGHGLPTSVNALHARLHANKKRLSIVKQSLMPKLFSHLGQLTRQVLILIPSNHWTSVRKFVKCIEEVIMSSFTAVLTNVPGPPRNVEMQGHAVRRWTASPPHAGKQTLGIGIISAISISVSADRVKGREGAARRITSKFEKRWQQYLDAADKVLVGIKQCRILM